MELERNSLMPELQEGKRITFKMLLIELALRAQNLLSSMTVKKSCLLRPHILLDQNVDIAIKETITHVSSESK